jgi:hypothetical protein
MNQPEMGTANKRARRVAHGGVSAIPAGYTKEERWA